MRSYVLTSDVRNSEHKRSNTITENKPAFVRIGLLPLPSIIYSPST